MHNLLKITLFIGAMCLSAGAIAAERNIALVLDASGSMNGRLADGTPKIDAAKAAVRGVVANLPDDVSLAFRAYGHQHHRSRHDCRDTELLVPFGAVGDNRPDVTARSDALRAQGYTPITYVLGLAADDLKPLSGNRTIVLVSDGKETCEGDPCLLARKLAEADAELTIHTVGFEVDAQARLQLQCIADVARGKYHDARSAEELIDTMEEAVEAAAPSDIQDEAMTITLPVAQEGKIQVVGPYFNEVVDAETGEKVAVLTDGNPAKTLPVGIYNVSFGKSQWLKSVAVRPNETTTITPGRLRVEQPYFNEVRDPETGEVVEKATDGHAEFPILAGRYDVAFGNAVWRGVVVNEGELTVLTPARLGVKGPYFNEVLDPETGEELLKLTDGTSERPLPPGTYDVRFGNKLWRGITLKAGEVVTLDPARFRLEDPYFNVIIDEATGEEVEKLTDGHNDLPLPPGTYTVMFGKAAWTGFTVAEGQTVVLNPGRIRIDGEKFYIDVLNEAGEQVIKLTEGTNDIPLPPGRYTLDVAGQAFPVTLSEGKRLVVKLQ